jgi:cell division protein FtsQ
MATRTLNPRRPVGRAAPRPSRTPARPRPAIRSAVLRRRLIAAAVGIVVIWAGYMLWFRNMSWFAIDEVTVTGATTNEPAIKSAIEQVAGDMTTLHLNDGKLRNTVGHFPTVASVGATTSFPHTLHVTVTERLPVAFIKVGVRRTAVSADGYLLLGASFDPKQLPRIEGSAANGARLDGDAAAQAAILGATPAPVRDRITGSSWDDAQGGVVVGLDGGPDLRFGDGSRARDKWTAALAVLSSSEHGSPSYLDVSVPDRPVSGG